MGTGCVCSFILVLGGVSFLGRCRGAIWYMCGPFAECDHNSTHWRSFKNICTRYIIPGIFCFQLDQGSTEKKGENRVTLLERSKSENKIGALGFPYKSRKWPKPFYLFYLVLVYPPPSCLGFRKKTCGFVFFLCVSPWLDTALVKSKEQVNHSFKTGLSFFLFFVFEKMLEIRLRHVFCLQQTVHF